MALVIFSITLFVSAFILFLVQPIIGKMILPKLGGTPQVWNTCMVFFQSALLAGYAYTHTSTTKFSLKRQLLFHMGFLVVPLLILIPFGGPFNFGDWTPPLGGNPILPTLMILTLLVGLPFIVVATSAPLLQRWFVHTGHPAANDPYFLYGASNLGSLLSLLAYPALVEPFLLLREQAYLWTGLYVVLAGLIYYCALTVMKAPAAQKALGAMPGSAVGDVPVAPQTDLAPQPPIESTTAVKAGAPKKRFGAQAARTEDKSKFRAQAPSIARSADDNITAWRRLRWILLAAAPSSLMLGVTNYISTDLSPIPLLWVIPLALYLLTFILVFMKWPFEWVRPLEEMSAHKIMLYLHPIGVLLGVSTLIGGGGFNPVWSTFLAMILFFTTTLVCHGELARDRPSSRFLTEFYLLMSVGGMLGGMFNGLVAPLLFYGVVEYPIAIALGCFLRPESNKSGWVDDAVAGQNLTEESRPISYALDFALPLILGIGTLLFLSFGPSPTSMLKFLKTIGLSETTARDWLPGFNRLLTLFIPMLICFFWHGRPLRFGLGVSAILMVHLVRGAMTDERAVYSDRSYFGVLRVRQTKDDEIGINTNYRDGTVIDRGTYHSLMHGTTHHGLNFQFPKDYPMLWRRLMTTYYHQYGPAGIVMKKYNWFQDGFRGETPKDWFMDLIKFHSDARLPASLVGLMAAPGVNPLPIEQLTALWSEPPYATIGLGTGTMAAYARPFQHCHYYEIDSLIRRLSLPLDKETKPLFTYLQDARERGANVQVLMGDARLRMAMPYERYNDANEVKGEGKGGGPESFYHMMVVDAFSSDAIPVHLITKEAIEMYFKKLVPEGILCVHTSNRHVDLVPVVASVAKSLGLHAKRGHDNSPFGFTGHFTSEWVMVARDESLLKALKAPKDYDKALRQKYPNAPAESYWSEPDYASKYVWTDDYSNVLRVFRWR